MWEEVRHEQGQRGGRGEGSGKSGITYREEDKTNEGISHKWKESENSEKNADHHNKEPAYLVSNAPRALGGRGGQLWRCAGILRGPHNTVPVCAEQQALEL